MKNPIFLNVIMSVHQVLKRGAFIFPVVIFLHYNNIQSTELGKYQALSDKFGGKSWPIGMAILKAQFSGMRNAFLSG